MASLFRNGAQDTAYYTVKTEAEQGLDALAAELYIRIVGISCAS